MLRTVAFNSIVLVTAFLGLALISGCGGADAEVEEVNVTIANLSDAAMDPESFRDFFVDGAVPDDKQRQRYRGLFYEMDAPKISGDSAVTNVRIINAEGEMLTEKEWSFAKVEGEWKNHRRAAALMVL